jgi:hypothetical protein
MRLSAAVAAVTLALVLCLPASDAPAQDAALDVKSGDTIRSILERQMGKRVALVLTTGPELAGVVKIVGDKVVQLSALSGREFYDAVVSLDHVGAVIVKVRSR